MSYILDALKKSEQERNLGKVPTLADLGQSPLPTSDSVNTAGRIKEIIIGVLVLVVIVGAYVFVTKNKAVIPSDLEQSIEQQTTLGNTKQEKKMLPSDFQRKPVLPQEQDILAIRDDFFTIPEKNKDVASEAKNTPQQETPAVIKKEESREDSLPVEVEVELDMTPLLSEVLANPLMDSTLMALPELSLDVHVSGGSSDDRFVFINMRKYREGDITDEGLSVDSIDSEGVILSFDGEQFRLPIHK